MLRIFILGSGRMAHHLASSVSETDMELVGCWSRNVEKGIALAEKFNTLFFSDIASIPQDCDIYFLAVSDYAIEQLGEQISHHGIAVHTSGAMSLDVLRMHSSRAVFWPIQSLSSTDQSRLKGAPVCLESIQDNDKRIMELFADKIQAKAIVVNEKQRMKLHLAAVIVNNFTNHLFYRAEQLLLKEQLPFSIMKPLMEETILKLNMMPPELAQTGPANRMDLNTIQKHLDVLKHDKELSELYKVLSNSIIHIKNPDFSLS